MGRPAEEAELRAGQAKGRSTHHATTAAEGRNALHLVITDSGLGGLSVCAGIERRLRQASDPSQGRLTYVNAWPDRGVGYNDLPDIAARARVLDRALAAMAALNPDSIVVACNTLSIVYPHTSFSRAPVVPVLGIVDAGVDLFHAALLGDPNARLVILGTKTTIESGVHRKLLVRKGVDARRITTVSCHGLAAAIEENPRGATVADLIAACTRGAISTSGRPERRLLLGLACTHYTYVKDELRAAMMQHSGAPVEVLDPNERLVSAVTLPPSQQGHTAGGRVAVRVLSKGELDDRKRQVMADLVSSISAETAAALLSYTHLPELF